MLALHTRPLASTARFPLQLPFLFIGVLGDSQASGSYTMYSLDLIIDEGKCRSIIAYKISVGTIHRIKANNTVIATEGYGRAYFLRTSAHICTGDW